MALCRIRFGLCFGLGLASFAANTRQSSGEKAGGDIDFAAFYILPVPSSLSAKWRRVKIGSLPSFSPSHRMPPKHTLRVRDHRLGVARPTASGMCGNNTQTGFYNSFAIPDAFRLLVSRTSSISPERSEPRGIPFLTHAPLARPSAMARFFS